MNTFLNRHKEQGELTTLLQNESNENQIILLTGYSGVGKNWPYEAIVFHYIVW